MSTVKLFLLKIVNTSMDKFDRVRVRGTAETGMILNIESKRDFNYNFVEFVTVRLDTGSLMVYDISELTHNLLVSTTFIN